MKSTFYPPNYTTIQYQIARTLLIGLSILLPGWLFAQNENLYYSEKDDATESIEALNIRGTSPGFSSISAGGDNPEAITVDVTGGNIYYVVSESDDDVYKINLSGAGGIIYTNNNEPTQGLGFNSTDIFWSDNANPDVVYSIANDGTGSGLGTPIYDHDVNEEMKGLQVVGAKIYIANRGAEEIMIAKAVAPFTATAGATTISITGNPDLEFFEVVEIGAETWVYFMDINNGGVVGGIKSRFHIINPGLG